MPTWLQEKPRLKKLQRVTIFLLLLTERSSTILAMARVTDTKERLLTAAIELLWEQSLGAASVDAICEKADVKKGKISIASPLARSLIGKTKGASVEVATPGGTRSFAIERVEWR